MMTNKMPPGLILKEEFITPAEEEELLKLMNMEETTEKGVMKHRQVKHYGFEFKYGLNDVDVTEPLPCGIPEICHGFLNKAIDLGLVKHFPDQLTVNQYKPGQGIPPHVDTVEAFEDGIMSLSLGSQVVMDFRHPDGEHLHVLLPRRSLLVMTGESRYVWSHGITPRKSDVVETSSKDGVTLLTRDVRTSLTFRKVVMNREERRSNSKIVDPDSKVVPQTENEAIELEHQHVHKVYDDIADHFSGTRYKPWPRVVEFIMAQPPLSLLVDVGCGNGKCLGLNKSLYEIGGDYSSKLVSICRSRGFESCISDVTCLPFRTNAFDVVLCIAVIHHMATVERRHQAVAEIVRILQPGGKALIYVWAMEQQCNNKQSKYISKKKQAKKGKLEDITKDPSEKEQNLTAETCKMEGDGFASTIGQCIEKTTAQPGSQGDNTTTEVDKNCLVEQSQDTSSSDTVKQTKTLSIHVNRTEFKEQDLLVPWQLKNEHSVNESPVEGKNIFHRFYHVFKQGELEQICTNVSGCRVRDSYYDQGNWCVVVEKL
ncbi:alkylated DNA repair protein alkB homolog 8-like isoform X2 [Physella acuta]|nr:alkylated DNA repair protein alkB homolog 8-like isoform X2 [Physella acuta]